MRGLPVLLPPTLVPLVCAEEGKVAEKLGSEEGEVRLRQVALLGVWVSHDLPACYERYSLLHALASAEPQGSHEGHVDIAVHGGRSLTLLGVSWHYRGHFWHE